MGVGRGTAGAGRCADEVRFGQLYEQCHRPIRDFCSRRVPADTVDDAVADTFLTIWRRLDEVPAGESALVWMYGVAYRVIRHQWRSLARRGRLQERLRTVGSSPAAAADDAIVDGVESRRVLGALARLGDTDAEVLRLVAWEQLSVADVAAVLGIEPDAARQRLHRARRNLARQYDRLQSRPTSTHPRCSDRRCPVITEDEVMRLLERADPARRSHTIPEADAAGYLAALRTRSTTVTLIDTEPTPTEPKSHRRWPIIAAAAAVVAIVVGGLVLATRDDDPNEQIPAATTIAPDPDASAAQAEEVARGFVDAYVAADADRALAYLADDVIATTDLWESPDGFRRDIAWQQAAMFKWNVHDCQRHDVATDEPQPLDDPAPAASGQPNGTTVRCDLDFHKLGSDAIGLGPYDISWDLTIRDGKIVSASRDQWVWTPQSGVEMWNPFANWIRTEHPDDVLVMYADSSQDWSQSTDEALRLWQQRTEEYVQAVLTGPETYAADVGAICATLAAQLVELAEPAEGALDQVAAWNTAAAAIMEQAHGELIAPDRPPGSDTKAYTSFYGRLFHLVRIAEESAAAASAGDSSRLAELDAEYVEVRQAASSVPAGSGLEECAANLPG